jgi:predicted phosphoribosyltransferase
MLAKALDLLRKHDPIVLGLANGGVVLGAVVAERLGAPLDVVVCKKVVLPANPEFAIGAVGPRGAIVANEDAWRRLGVSAGQFEGLAVATAVDVERRSRVLRGDRPFPDLTGRTVILVDDGLATGSTALVAIQFVREMGASKIVIAAPICSDSAELVIKRESVDLVCISEPSPFKSVGQWYDDFTQVRDEEIIPLLHS